MSTHDGGPAFPVNDGALLKHPGMSLRDYFAARQMEAATLANFLADRPPVSVDSHQFIAQIAYEQADAMLAERASREGSNR